MKQMIRLLLLMSFAIPCLQTSCFAMQGAEKEEATGADEQHVEVKKSRFREFLSTAYAHKGKIIFGGMALAIMATVTIYPDFMEILKEFPCLCELIHGESGQSLPATSSVDEYVIDAILQTCRGWIQQGGAEPLSMFFKRCLDEGLLRMSFCPGC